MKRFHSILTTAVLALAMSIASSELLAQEDSDEHAMRTGAPTGVFRTTAIRFEVNETDQDAEVVINFKAAEGLKRLIVIDPRGNRVADLKSNDGGRIGLAQGILETPEPSAAAVRAAFPEGKYSFFGRTISGKRLFGTANLSHVLLAAPSFVPRDGQLVDRNNITVQWTHVPGAAGYVVGIEDDLGFNLTATVTPDVFMLPVPSGVLRPGTTYKIVMSTITSQGNVSVAESSFVTAP